jgi:hypothetical protein
MPVYLFLSTKEPSIRAFTADETGVTLPADYAPWERARVGDVIPVTATSGPVLSAIERDGFFLMSGIHAQFKRWKVRR